MGLKLLLRAVLCGVMLCCCTLMVTVSAVSHRGFALEECHRICLADGRVACRVEHGCWPVTVSCARQDSHQLLGAVPGGGVGIVHMVMPAGSR